MQGGDRHDRRRPASRRSSRCVAVESDDRRHRRAPRRSIVGFGAEGGRRASRSLVGDTRWFVQRRGARLLGRIGTADAVPLLQPLLRQSDPRVAREAVAALGVHPRSGGGARHPHRAARGHRRRCGARSSTRWSPSAIRASCRCWSASSRRASRSARITRSCSRRSTRCGTVGTDDGGARRSSTMAQAQAVPRRQEAARAEGAQRRRAGARSATDKATAALEDAADAPATGMLQEDRQAAKLADGTAEGRRARSGGSPRRCAAPSCTRRRTRWSSAASTR